MRSASLVPWSTVTSGTAAAPVTIRTGALLPPDEPPELLPPDVVGAFAPPSVPVFFHGQRAADGHTAHRHDQRDHQTRAGQRHSGVNAQLADRHAALDVELCALRVLADSERLHVRIQCHVGAAEKLHELRGDFDLDFLI